jgi:hypothetical protein
MALHHSSDDDDGRVIRFRPRQRPRRWRPSSPVPDLSQYESAETEGEYRHRMLMNALGFGAAAVLVVTGLWLVSMLIETEATHPQHRQEGGLIVPTMPAAPSISPAASPE